MNNKVGSSWVSEILRKHMMLEILYLMNKVRKGQDIDFEIIFVNVLMTLNLTQALPRTSLKIGTCSWFLFFFFYASNKIYVILFKGLFLQKHYVPRFTAFMYSIKILGNTWVYFYYKYML